MNNDLPSCKCLLFPGTGLFCRSSGNSPLGVPFPVFYFHDNSRKGKIMHEYEVHVWINGQCLHVTITAPTTTQARRIAEAQYPAARMISVLRQIN
jgi:hypothetical protein